jgi:hypothetical protein
MKTTDAAEAKMIRLICAVPPPTLLDLSSTVANDIAGSLNVVLTNFLD